MHTATAIQSNASAEKHAKRFWMALVLMLFVVQATIMGLALRLSIGDPAGAVVPNYHDRALNWDASRRSHEAATRLGWGLSFYTSDVVDGKGMRAIEMTIVDASGIAIDGLDVSGILYHHARADDVLSVSLQSTGDGRYLTLAPIGRSGYWQLELDIAGASEPVAQSINFFIQGS